MSIKNNLKINLLLILFLIVQLLIINILAGIFLEGRVRIVIFIFAFLIFLTLFLFLWHLFSISKKNKFIIQEGFEYFSTELMSLSGVGLLIFNSNFQIIWVSSLVQDRFKENLIGKKIDVLSPKLLDLINNNEENVIFDYDNLYYATTIFHDKKSLLIKDITTDFLANQYYTNKKLVIGEVSIDSYAQYQNSLEEETLYKIDIAVAKILDDLMSKYDILYKKYGPGKFLLLTNNSSLQEMENKNFKFLDPLQTVSKKLGVKVSLSLGFGTSSSVFTEIENNARDALTQSQARGGDQVTIVSSLEGNRYYGGSSEATPSTSRISIRLLTERITKILTTPAAIKKVIIFGHRNADLDVMGAALGIVALAKATKKEVYICNSTFDTTTTEAIDKWLADEPSLFIKTGKAKRLIDTKTLGFIVDTSNPEQLEGLEAVLKIKQDNLYILDHHRVPGPAGFQFWANQAYVNTSASSTSEIVTEILSFFPLHLNLPKNYLQFLLSGIYLDTNQFQKTTSMRTYEAAAWLENKGASPQMAVDILKADESETNIIYQIEQAIEEVKPGYFLSVYNGDLPSHIVAKAGNELLRTRGRRATFVIAKIPGENKYRMSARSIDVNVQVIAENVGGGGHFSAAAAVSEESLETFKGNIIQAIVSVRKNENYNG